uniref:Uncharacterized protein n=1 Tax=Oryza punctata TaxID=4537 RepID=A0A0E0JNB6_ORYPU
MLRLAVAATGYYNLETVSNLKREILRKRHTSDVTNLIATELRRKRERERYASLSTKQKQARLQKNREYKQRKKEATTSLSELEHVADFFPLRD